jgi:putative radical SAM enzyme (TIGR03279 family)
MSLPRIVAVDPGSPASRAGLEPGDELLSVNGEAPRDVIRYRVLTDEPLVEVELRRGGLERAVRVEKRAGEPLGAEVQSALFDRVRTCDNHCPFCFIYQLPKGMRRSLYVKDDDYRLSFLYGNFTTLTRFTEADLERVLDEGLGPLYVSIHATDPEVRTRLLRNRRGATSLRWLRLLLDHGVEVHGQVVVCPGVNDAAVLDDTLFGVLERYPELASVGLVPLGVSAHNAEPDMRPHREGEAEAVVDTCHRWQDRFLDILGRRVVFAADEYYLMAGRPFPEAEEYEGFPQHENGIGMARTFESEVRAALAGPPVGEARSGPPAGEARFSPPAPAEATGGRGGFFAWVDGNDGQRYSAGTATPSGRWTAMGAPAEGYRSPRRTGAVSLAVDGSGRASEVALLTGQYGARVLEPLLPALSEVAQAEVRTFPVPNRIFGGNIAVTGLLTGTDLAPALEEAPAGWRYLLPDTTLSRDVFLDGSSPADLPRPVEVVPTDGRSLVEALQA